MLSANSETVDKALVEKLRQLFRLKDDDLVYLREVGRQTLPLREQFLDELYRHILSFPELAELYRGDQSLRRDRAGQGKHLTMLLSGQIDEEFIRHGLRVGQIHDVMGVEPTGYLAGYACYVEVLMELLSGEGTPQQPRTKYVDLCRALVKTLLLDIALAWEAYTAEKLRRINETYRVLEIDHNLALQMLQEQDREIERLRQAAEGGH